MAYLNYRVTACDEALNELLFWKDIPRLRFESDIWLSTMGFSIRVATDAIDFGLSGHTLGGISYIVHEYFSEYEALQSSTYRKLLGVNRCLKSLIDLCRNKFVLLQVNARNRLGVINPGSPKIPLHVLLRELFWLCLAKRVVISVEWVPQESNAFADKISKWLIPHD